MSAAGSPCENTIAPGRYFTTFRAGPADSRYATASNPRWPFSVGRDFGFIGKSSTSIPRAGDANGGARPPRRLIRRARRRPLYRGRPGGVQKLTASSRPRCQSAVGRSMHMKTLPIDAHLPVPHLEHGHELPKTLTGIRGLDEITRGGLPKGRPTLVCGGPGSGKTLLGAEFLVKGALQFGEPGVFVSF